MDINLLTLTLNSVRLYSANNHDHLFRFITVIANANVPPQGKQPPWSNMIKCKWVKRLLYERHFINPLAFDMQMVRMRSPNETLPIHLH
jgi:hypothetical protein